MRLPENSKCEYWDNYSKLTAKNNRKTDWIESLNAHFSNTVKVFCQCRFEPVIHIDGAYQLSDEQQYAAERYRVQLNAAHRPNDLHAILTNTPAWQTDPVVLHARRLDFASVCALREQGNKPAILSSSAVIVCPETSEILLNRRASNLATYPGCLHMPGGAFIPDGTTGIDDTKLSNTIIREVYEETRIRLHWDALPPMMIAQELSTGFIQLALLGLTVSRSALDSLENNWEGVSVRIPFDHLADALNDPTWVPSGKAQMLAWLAKGAPGAGLSARFGGQTAHELFATAMKA